MVNFNKPKETPSRFEPWYDVSSASLQLSDIPVGSVEDLVLSPSSRETKKEFFDTTKPKEILSESTINKNDSNEQPSDDMLQLIFNLKYGTSSHLISFPLWKEGFLAGYNMKTIEHVNTNSKLKEILNSIATVTSPFKK